jgi:hypothetical protein
MPNPHGEGETHEDELPEAGNEEEQRADLEEEAERIHEEANENVREAMNEITTTSGDTSIRIVDITLQLPAVERAFTPKRARDVAKEAAADPETGSSEKAANEAAVETTLEEAAATDAADDPAAEQKTKEKKELSLRKQMLMMTGALLFGPKLLGMFEAMVQGANGKGLDHLIKDATERAKLTALLTAIAGEPDEQFWSDFADFVGKNNSTLAELVYFLQYIMLLSPLDDPFTWESWSEESGKVDELIQAFNDAAESPKSVLIKKLPTVVQNDMPVPRYIQASLGQLAFGSLAQTTKAKPAEDAADGNTNG